MKSLLYCWGPGNAGQNFIPAKRDHVTTHLVSNNTTIHSFTKEQISSILDQIIKDIDRFEGDAKNHKKEIKKLKKEL